MKILAKKKVDLKAMVANQKPMKRGPGADTSELVRRKLAELSPKNATLLGTVPSSDSSKPPYKIMLSGSNTVSCGCQGFKFRNTCGHLDRFKAEHKPVVLK